MKTLTISLCVVTLAMCMGVAYGHALAYVGGLV